MVNLFYPGLSIQRLYYKYCHYVLFLYKQKKPLGLLIVCYFDNLHYFSPHCPYQPSGANYTPPTPRDKKSKVWCNLKLELIDQVWWWGARSTKWLSDWIFVHFMPRCLYCFMLPRLEYWGLKILLSGRRGEEKLCQWLPSDSIDYNCQTMCKEFLVKTIALYSWDKVGVLFSSEYSSSMSWWHSVRSCHWMSWWHSVRYCLWI